MCQTIGFVVSAQRTPRLQANMRARNVEHDWHDFVLDIFNGVANDVEGHNNVREEPLCSGNIVTEIFGKTLDPKQRICVNGRIWRQKRPC
ncbi:hypothetical protein Aduo_015310 [Ancylostoma duodenale]